MTFYHSTLFPSVSERGTLLGRFNVWVIIHSPGACHFRNQACMRVRDQIRGDMGHPFSDTRPEVLGDK